MILPDQRIKLVKDFPAAAKAFDFRHKCKLESQEAETNETDVTTPQ